MNEFAPQPDRKVTYKALNSEAVAAARAAAGAAGLTTEDWLSRVILENAQANGIITSDPGFGVAINAGTRAQPLVPESGPTSADCAAGPEDVVAVEHQPVAPQGAAMPGSGSAGEPNGASTAGQAPVAGPTTAKAGAVAGLAQQLQQAKQAADQAGVSIASWLNRAIIDSARAQVSPRVTEETGADDADQAVARSGAGVGSGVGLHTETESIPDRSYPDVRRDADRESLAQGENASATWDDIAASTQNINGQTAESRPIDGDAAGAAPSAAGQQGVPDGIPHRPAGDIALPVSASDPLQERLARIVAARREEQAQFDHPDDPPMILASRPKEAGKSRPATTTTRGATRGLVDFDEVDRRSHSGNLSWFWMTMMIILTGLAGIIWALPFLGTDPAGARTSATTAAIPPVKSTGVSIPARKPTVTGTALPKPAHQFVEQWRKAAAAGNPVAQVGLAKLMLAGKGVSRDPAAAAKMLRQAADSSNAPEAQFLLAFLLERGLGVTKSFVDATLYYQKAAAQGYLPAVTEVGIAFLYGIGVKRDFQKAFRYLERAAEAGLPKAQYTLGRAYESGIGVTKNRIMALKWYILAAERQHAAATSRIEDISHKTKKPERDKATELAREHNQRYRDTDRSGSPN